MKTFFIGRGGENIVTKGEEKAEVLSTFASVFDNKTNHPQDSWPPELVDGVREQNSPPVIQEEVVTSLATLKSQVCGTMTGSWLM